MNKIPKWLIALGVGLVLVVVLIASLVGGGPHGIEVEAQAATEREIISRVKATGEITPDHKVEVSSRVVGEITELPVKEGDTVSKGDLLVQIEKALYESSRNEAAATLRQTEVAVKRLNVQLRVAEKNLSRMQELQKNGFASTEQVESAQAEVDTLRVEVEAQTHAVARARSALQRTVDSLEQTTIRSPMDGTVIQLDKEVGETVIAGEMNIPGSVIMVVADMSTLVVVAEVTEVDVVNVEVGQRAEVHLDALGDKTQQGHVVFVGASGRKDPALGVIRFEVRVALDDPDPALRPPMTAKVDILTNTAADALSVPIQAVVKRRLDENGKAVTDDDRDDLPLREVVFVIRDGKAHLQPVTTGNADVLYVEILEGLADGDLVVTGPYRTLKTLEDGQAVAVEEGGAEDTAAPPSPKETEAISADGGT